MGNSSKLSHKKIENLLGYIFFVFCKRQKHKLKRKFVDLEVFTKFAAKESYFHLFFKDHI